MYFCGSRCFNYTANLSAIFSRAKQCFNFEFVPKYLNDRKLATYFKKNNTKPEQLLQIIWDYTNGRFNPVECFQHALPNQNHHLIAELVAEGINCIITPNFDSCLERALEARHIDFEFFNRTPSTNSEADHLLSSIKGKNGNFEASC